MSSPSASSVSRYRPIVALTVGIATLGVLCLLYSAYRQPPTGGLHRSNAVYRRRRNPRTRAHSPEQSTEQPTPSQTLPEAEQDAGSPTQAPTGGLDGAETVAETEIEGDWAPSSTREPVGADPRPDDGRNLKQLLYYIAEEQCRQEAYIHHGVSCNSCDLKPIRGIRWRCSNCIDYDLCSECEAQSLHPKTHIFYKIKIPAPFMGHPRQSIPVVYPGKPHWMPRILHRDLRVRLVQETLYEHHEIDALYDQFTCLAGRAWRTDPNNIGAAIDRPCFNKSFVPLVRSRVPKPNLVYDRIFSFYDTNRDGLIGFEEFVKGLALLHAKAKGENRQRKVFEGYDIDADGWVSRKDFLRIFRAWYAIQKEIAQDLISLREEEITVQHTVESLATSQPLSSLFTEPFSPPIPRSPLSKPRDSYGDRRSARPPVSEDSEDRTTRGEAIWQSITSAPTPVEQETKEAEARTELRDRWERREFYTDMEEDFESYPRDDPGQGIFPAGGINGSFPFVPEGCPRNSNVPRSATQRSGSKVRFKDDPSLETRSNASTSSRPVNERFGGYEIPEAEKDFGTEILYLIIQQSMNDLLNPIFRSHEDAATVVKRTKVERRRWRSVIDEAIAVAEKRKSAEKSSGNPLTSINGDEVQAASEQTDELQQDSKANGDPDHNPLPFDALSQDPDAGCENSDPFAMEGDDLDSFFRSMQATSAFLHPIEGDTPLHQLLRETRPPQTPANTKDSPHTGDTLPNYYGSSSSHFDPTMPQFRPNSAADIPSSNPLLFHPTSNGPPTQSVRFAERIATTNTAGNSNPSFTSSFNDHSSSSAAPSPCPAPRSALRSNGAPVPTPSAANGLGRPSGTNRSDTRSAGANSTGSNGSSAKGKAAQTPSQAAEGEERPTTLSRTQLDHLVDIERTERKWLAEGRPAGHINFEEFQEVLNGGEWKLVQFVDQWLTLGSF